MASSSKDLWLVAQPIRYGRVGDIEAQPTADGFARLQLFGLQYGAAARERALEAVTVARLQRGIERIGRDALFTGSLERDLHTETVRPRRWLQEILDLACPLFVYAYAKEARLSELTERCGGGRRAENAGWALGGRIGIFFGSALTSQQQQASPEEVSSRAVHGPLIAVDGAGRWGSYDWGG